MRTIKASDLVTYAALERALTTLGFSKKELRNPEARLFEHQATQATIILPAGEPDATVQPGNYVSARHTIVANGIASPERYAATLRQARRAVQRPARLVRRSTASKVRLKSSPDVSAEPRLESVQSP